MGMNVTQAASFAVLVISCDKYADLWSPFFKAYKAQFSDWAQTPLYLGSNAIDCNEPGVITLKVGDTDWSSGLMKLLDGIPNEYVLTMLEDFFLSSPLSLTRLNDALAEMRELKAHCVKLHNYTPSSLVSKTASSLELINAGTPYRVCTQAAIWKKSTLQSLVIRGESPWQFENNATLRANNLSEKEFRVARTNVITAHYEHVVERGMWRPQCRTLIESAGVNFATSERPMMTGLQQSFAKLKAWAHEWVWSLPPDFREPFLRVGAGAAKLVSRIV